MSLLSLTHLIATELRSDATVLAQTPEYVTYDIGGDTFIEIPNSQVSRFIANQLGMQLTPQSAEAFVQDGNVICLENEITQEQSNQLDSRSLNQLKRSGFAFKLDHIKVIWEPLFLGALIGESNGWDGVGIKVVEYIISTLEQAPPLDPKTDVLSFARYAYVMYKMHTQTNEQIDVNIALPGTHFGGQLSSFSMDEHWASGPYIEFEVETFTMFRGEIRQETRSITIPLTRFVESTMAEQQIRPITEEERAGYANRTADVMSQLDVSGVSYVHYTGEALIPFVFGPYPEYVNDRVIVDPVSLYTVNTSTYRNMVSSCGFDCDNDIKLNQEFNKSVIDDSNAWMLYPVSFGYVFQSKRWAMLDLSHSSEIVFRSDAIDKIVIDQSRKDLILALVNNNCANESDIIDGKGGGMITLLHGAPGLGKTLIAEVVAEHTTKPLYKVSVGELGTSPDELEERLTGILNIATRWGAILLIDEADIFLESRTTDDIERNAMVAIFLRLLEYYEGIMFLTTNRVNNFDPAFFSRIMIAFGFNELSDTDRRSVWVNLLSNSGIDLDATELSALSKYDVNARQIKNAIHCAKALAKSTSSKPGYRQIKTILQNTEEFISEIAPKQ